MTKPNRSMVGLVGLTALLAAACANQSARNQPPQRAQLAQAIATPLRGHAVEPLSPLAMAMLKTRMSWHARDMNRLVSSIMILDYPDIAARSREIAEDVSLRRPVSSDAPQLNASLPTKFFLRQGDLKAAARELSAAASALNPYRVADAYGKVSQGCVRCHEDYRPRTGT